MSENRVVAVLKRAGDLTFRSSDDVWTKVVRDRESELLVELHADENHELGIIGITVLLVTDSQDNVIDIRQNELSVGYYATRELCSAYGLQQAELLYQGEFSEDRLREISSKESVSIVCLFNEEIEL